MTAKAIGAMTMQPAVTQRREVRPSLTRARGAVVGWTFDSSTTWFAIISLPQWTQ
jgi:hypothetical protein